MSNRQHVFAVFDDDSFPRSHLYLEEHALPQSITEVLESPLLRAEFRTFLEHRVAVENLVFLETVSVYEHLPVLCPEEAELPGQRRRLGRFLVESFVANHSPNWVNLPHVLTKNLLNTVEFKEDTFDDAKYEITILLRDNFFQSFRDYLCKTVDEEIEQEEKEREDLDLIRRTRMASITSAAESYLTGPAIESVQSINSQTQKDNRKGKTNKLRQVAFPGPTSLLRSFATRKQKKICTCEHPSPLSLDDPEDTPFCCEKRRKVFKKQVLKMRKVRSAPQVEFPNLPPASNNKRGRGRLYSVSRLPKSAGSTSFEFAANSVPTPQPKPGRTTMINFFAKSVSHTRNMSIWNEMGLDQEVKKML